MTKSWAGSDVDVLRTIRKPTGARSAPVISYASANERLSRPPCRGMDLAHRCSPPESVEHSELRAGTMTTMQPRPQPPFPEQHLPKPGLESDLEPRPMFEAPA